jgi:hypothetical protein
MTPYATSAEQDSVKTLRCATTGVFHCISVSADREARQKLDEARASRQPGLLNSALM